MRIPKKYHPSIIVLLISGAMFAWGAFSLNINNTATVVIAQRNFAVEIIAVGSTCPAYGSPLYNLSNSTIALSWPPVTEPGTASFLFCLENVGSATFATFVQGPVTPSPSPGTLSVTPVGSVPISATGVTAITTTLEVSVGVPATVGGTNYSFSLTIG